MRLPDPGRPRRAGIGLTPLIDVVFILLLFFLLASELQPYGGLSLKVPNAATTGAAPGAGPPIRVHLRADGGLEVDGAVIPMVNLGAALGSLRAARPAAPVLVSAAPDAALQSLVGLLDALAAAGVCAPVLE